MWIVTGGGLVKLNKTTGAKTFLNRSNSGLPNNFVRSIAIDGSGNKWIGTYGGGLAKYDGTTWTVYNTSNSDLPDNAINTIKIDGSENKWIGASGGGLAKFNSTGWTVYNASNSGLPSNYIQSIAIDGSGNKWMGTWGGLAVFNEGGVVNSIEELQKKETSTASLLQNFPNPFSNSTTIKYKVTESGFVSLKVFDTFGREVASLVNEKKPAGEYSVDWNASGFHDGMYFCRMQAGEFSDTKKLIFRK